MRHTPGPWFVDMSDARRVLANDARETIICEALGGASNPRVIADTRLIAAAPDLLHALEAIERDSEDEFSRDCARAAIKKARA